MISVFRQIYKACFQTNKYITGYRKKFNICEVQCEQIIHNLLFVNDFYSFNNHLRELAKEFCPQNLSDNFNILDFKKDDLFQKKKFLEEKQLEKNSEKENENLLIIQMLFDQLDTDVAKIIINQYSSRLL
jgi:hypothetical protein